MAAQIDRSAALAAYRLPAPVTPGYVMPTLLPYCCRHPQPYIASRPNALSSQAATGKPGNTADNTGELQRRLEMRMRMMMASGYDQSSAALEACDIDEALTLIEDSEPWAFTDPADEPE